MSKTIAAEVSEDLFTEIEEYCEEGESRSAAIRRLIRTGIEHANKPDEDTDTGTDTDLGNDALLVFGVLLLATPLIGDPPLSAPAAGVITIFYERYNLHKSIS